MQPVLLQHPSVDEGSAVVDGAHAAPGGRRRPLPVGGSLPPQETGHTSHQEPPQDQEAAAGVRGQAALLRLLPSPDAFPTGVDGGVCPHLPGYLHTVRLAGRWT